MLGSKPSVCYEANRAVADPGTRVYTPLGVGVCCMGAEDWSDPYGIIPQSFRRRFGDYESVAEALQAAGAARSTTPESERPRCPYCGSLSVEQRTDRSHQMDSNLSVWKCRARGCRRGFDEPADETMIPLTDSRTDPFSWIDREELDDPDTRGEGALFASLDEETRIGLAIVLYRPWTDAGPSLRQLAALFPHTRYWVGERTREWKDGDHRDLVGAPRRDPDPSPEVDASASVEAAADGGTPRSRWAAYGSD